MPASDRQYRILVGTSREAVAALARDGWKLLESTVKEFTSLDTDDDQGLGDIGRVAVQGPGFVGLAWK